MTDTKRSLDGLRIERKPMPKANSRPWLVIGLVLGLAVSGLLAWRLSHPKALVVHTALAREAASSGIDRTVLNASGYVTARRQSTVSSKVTGKVIEVLVEEGVRVKEGDVLARLDDTNVKASLRLAEAQLLSAKAAREETRVRLREANQEWQRQSGLLKSDSASQADNDHAEATALAYQAKLNQQEVDVNVAERLVATWQQQLEDMVIRAPFPGIVTAKNAQPGEMISPMSAGGYTRTGICTLVDMESLEIEIDVNESYINRVQPSQPVEATLDAYTDWKIPCKVIAIIPTADRQKSTVKVRVGFDKLDPRILPEMSVKVAFRETGDAAPAIGRAIAIPKSALHQLGGRDVVFVLHNEHLERRAVRVNAVGTQESLLSAGLMAGEKVVVDGPAELAEGTAVVEAK